GLKVMVLDADPETAAGLSDSRTVWGYYIADEPYPEDKFPGLADKVMSFRRADPNHVPYINMLSNTGSFLDSFVETVRPLIHSFDYYQWWWGSEPYFEKLEQHRKTALKAGIPLFTWIEVNTDPMAELDDRHASPPSDNVRRLRQSVYTSLAYGVKGIEWFTASKLFVTGSSGLEACGTDVAAINSELKRLGPILVDLQSVDVFHTRPLPRNTREAPQEHWVRILGEQDDGAVMGTFKNAAGTDYIMVTNRNYRNAQYIQLRFRPLIKKMRKFDRQTGEWIELSQRHKHSLALIIEPGDGELIEVIR
ncbi:hypothetical protein ACFL60_08325, partial [Candidatus Omnitrophota bacterium]